MQTLWDDLAFYGLTSYDLRVIRPATTLDLTEAGLDPNVIDLTGWTVSTTINATDADVNGFELSMNQSLRGLDPWLAGWGGYFNLFANATKLKIKGPGVASLSGFLPLGINGGIRFTEKPFMISVSANHRGEETTAVVTDIGPNGRNYYPATTQVDLALGINLRRNLSFFVNIRDTLNRPLGTFKESDLLPAYARANASTVLGAQGNAGIRGSF